MTPRTFLRGAPETSKSGGGIGTRSRLHPLFRRRTISVEEGRAMQDLPFRDRIHAGQFLSRKLKAYADRPDVIVLALPRGGVPVAREIARVLHVPLDVFLVRKLGTPGQEELAMGAIASGGIRVLNEEVVRSLHVSKLVIEQVTARELRELARRERLYREGRLPVGCYGQRGDPGGRWPRDRVHHARGCDGTAPGESQAHRGGRSHRRRPRLPGSSPKKSTS